MIRADLLAGSLVLSCAAVMVLQAGSPAAPLPAAHPPAPPIKVTGPIKSGNLSVYLIHGKDKLPGAKILTLQEALAQKKIVVHETGNVNELTVENKSDKMVFIQSGDIVRGGQQDRTMQYDILVPKKSGLVKVPAFCVDQGRWTQRGTESAQTFNSSANALASRELKIAAKAKGDQGQVWQNVSNLQGKLQTQSGYTANEADPSSCELTLDDAKVTKAATVHMKDLENAINAQNDVIGYGFAINGKINSADVYASHELFVKLWPKLLKASAIEAVADAQAGKQLVPPPPAVAVSEFVTSAGKAQRHIKYASKASLMTESESPRAYFYAAAAPSPIVSHGAGAAPPMQGATNGSIGPQGVDATYVTGVNTAGTVSNSRSPGSPAVHINILAK